MATLIKRMLDVRKEKRIRWTEIIETIYEHFPFIIYKGEQLLNHQSTLAKILRDVLELLSEEKTTNELAQAKLEKKVKSKVTNLLILLQYDEMCDAEQALQRCGSYRGGFLLPHILDEVRDPQIDEKFQAKKASGIDLRKVVAGKIAIEKLREPIGKDSADLMAKLEEAMESQGSTKPFPNLCRIVKALGWLRNYNSLFELVNNNKLNTVLEQMFAP